MPAPEDRNQENDALAAATADDPPRTAADLFHDALTLPPEQEDDFLAAHCVADSVLRHRLKGMLRAARAHPEILEVPSEAPPAATLGHYRLLDECGRGGMGVVYRALDTRLRRIVALKIVREGPARNPRAGFRFYREARILAALSHDNIATLFDADEVDGFAFLTMEFVEGDSLAAILDRRRMPVRETIRLGESLASALEYAHERQIVHRDLKPSNIMVSSGGRVKVLDFGIAGIMEEEPTLGVEAYLTGASLSVAPTTLRGTPGYMSPEQLRGDPGDARSDLWQLGCVLFECLASRPYRGDEPEAAEPQSRAGALDLGPSVPRPLARMIECCLAESPDLRPASAGEVRAVLGELLRPRTLTPLRLAGVLGILLVLSMLLFLVRSSRPGDLVTVQAAGPSLVRALDAKDRTVWSCRIPGVIEGTVRPGKFACFDDRLAPANNMLFWGRGGSGRSYLWMIQPDNGTIAWALQAGFPEPPVNAQDSPEMQAARWISFDGGARPVLAVTVKDGTFYSNSVQFYSEDHELLGVYMHPGPIDLAGCAEFAGSGRGMVVFSGMNSSARFVRELVPSPGNQHCGCLVLLDSPVIHGQAFPYSDSQPEQRDWPGAPRANEYAYLVVPPLAEDVRPETRLLTTSDHGFVWTLDDGRVFSLDAALRPSYCVLCLDSPAARLLRGRTARVGYVHNAVVTYLDVSTGS